MTDTRLAIGLDIGGTKIAGAVVDVHGTVVAELVEPTPEESSGEAVTEVLLSLIERFRAEHSIATIGVGAAGIVQWPEGRMLWAPNNAYRDWPVREQLEKSSSLPVVVDNDANVAALAEHRAGAAQGAQDAVVLTVGTGIGGEVQIGNRNGEWLGWPYQGDDPPHGFPGEDDAWGNSPYSIDVPDWD